MSVLKPRNRLVNFRLSEEEFQAMHAACEKSGARSLSDFARGAVLHAMQQAERGMQVSGDAASSVFARLESLLTQLESRLPAPDPSIVNNGRPLNEPAQY